MPWPKKNPSIHQVQGKGMDRWDRLFPAIPDEIRWSFMKLISENFRLVGFWVHDFSSFLYRSNENWWIFPWNFLSSWLWTKFPSESCGCFEKGIVKPFWKLTWIPPKRGTISKGNESSNHWFSRDISSFLGILAHLVGGWARGVESSPKRKVFRFHETIISFGEPGSLGFVECDVLPQVVEDPYPTA